MYLGELIEFGETELIFTTRERSDRGLHHRPVRLRRHAMPAEHIIKRYDEELDRLNKMIVEMGGLAEASWRRHRRGRQARQRSRPQRRRGRRQGRPDRARLGHSWRSGSWRCVSRWPATCARSRRAEDRQRSRADRRRRRNIAKRWIALASTPPLAAGRTICRGWRDLAPAGQGRDRRLCRARRRQGARRMDARRGARRDVSSLFRELLTYMMEDPRIIAPARTSSSSPRTSSGSATTPPTSPRTCTMS